MTRIPFLVVVSVALYRAARRMAVGLKTHDEWGVNLVPAWMVDDINAIFFRVYKPQAWLGTDRWWP